MTDSGDQRPVRRPVVVTAIMLVAVAVMLVALRSWLDRPAAEIGIGGEVSVAIEAEPAFEPEPIVEPSVAASPPVAPAADPIPVVTQTVPLAVVMLPARVANSDPAAAAVTEAVRQSTLRALRAMPGMDVVELSPVELASIVPPNAGPLGADNLVYLAVTGRHAGRVVAEISEQTAADNPLFWLLNLRVRRQNGGGSSVSTIGKNGDPRLGEDVESLGIRYAERIAQDAERVAQETSPVSSSSPAAANARNVLLDATRSEGERLRSLTQLFNEERLDSATIAAAVDLATRSASAETRQRVWMLLRRSAYEPALAQPLSYALLSDGDASVRKEAALGLAAYVGDATALAALEHASRNDLSSEVRLAARMATMDFDEQQAFRRETLLDRSLTPAERLAPTVVDSSSRVGGLGRSNGIFAMEEALAYAEIVTAVEDPMLKLRGLSELQSSMFGSMGPSRYQSGAVDAKIVDALIETSRHADDRVRRQALNALSSVAQLSGNTDARAVLESVLENEPDLAAELRIANALESLERRSTLNVSPR